MEDGGWRKPRMEARGRGRRMRDKIGVGEDANAVCFGDYSYLAIHAGLLLSRDFKSPRVWIARGGVELHAGFKEKMQVPDKIEAESEIYWIQHGKKSVVLFRLHRE